MQGMKRVFTQSAMAAVVAAGIFLPGEAAACGPDSYLGSICFMTTSYCPEGTVQANGQTMPINQNQALYSLLGTLYGGNGTTDFGIPDLRGRAAIGTGVGVDTLTVTRGQLVGKATQSAPVPVPQHTHTATFSPTDMRPGTGTTPVTVAAISGGGLTISGLNITNTLNLLATTKGSVKLASSTGAGATSTPSNGAVLAKPPLSAPNIYSSTATADTNIGPEQSFSGAVTGSVTSVVSGGTVTGTPTIPSFTVNVPKTLTEGTVAVAPTGSASAAVTVPVQTPGQGFTACIVTSGVYPMRP